MVSPFLERVLIENIEATCSLELELLVSICTIRIRSKNRDIVGFSTPDLIRSAMQNLFNRCRELSIVHPPVLSCCSFSVLFSRFSGWVNRGGRSFRFIKFVLTISSQKFQAAWVWASRFERASSDAT